MSRQNGISIEDMLKLDIMKSCELIAGSTGIRNTVSRVNIMADPDILDWTKEGEFLLTTAYSFKKDKLDAQIELIKECSAKKMAGIGIKITPYLDSLAPEILELADKLNFPIIDIHYSIPLSDVMMEVFKEVFNKQASLLERIEKIHERLMNTMLEGKDLDALIEIVQENIKNPTILYIGYSNEYIECLGASEKDKEELLRQVRDFYEPSNQNRKLKKLIEDQVLIGPTYVKRMIMPILLRDQIYAHLFTWASEMP